jgi:hypothetical protein
MYHILESRKLTKSLNSLPTVREIHFDDVIEIRRSIGQGAYVCKLLAKKAILMKMPLNCFTIK